MDSPEAFLVLAATAMELEPLRRRAGARPAVDGPVPAHEGRIGGVRVVLAATGVGKSSAAFAAGYLLARAPFGALVNLGSGGAFPRTGLSVGDVVLADREILADEGAIAPEGFLDLAALGLAALAAGEAVQNLVPIRPLLSLAPPDICDLSAALGFPVRAGPLATVSAASGTDARSEEIFGRWHPLAESLEGAALALAAHRLGLPFLEVRGISNLTGDRRRDAWDLRLAVERATGTLVRVLELLERARAAAPSGGR